MDTLTISPELAAIQGKTRRLMLWSFLVHCTGIVAFLAVTSQPVPVVENPTMITEITWLEPEISPVEIAVAAPQVVIEEPAEALVLEKPKPVIPPRDSSLDLLQQRLAALRSDDNGRQEIISAAFKTTTARSTPATLGVFATRQKASAKVLNRAVVRPVSRITELPKERPSIVAVAVTTLPETGREAPSQPAKEIMPGVSLAGEVSNRRLVDFITPQYPEWAKRDGVEVSVELFFTVLPSGRVKENVLIERTSGFDDFDRRAEAALSDWRFESLAPGAAAEQWGRIEFKYRLRDAG